MAVDMLALCRLIEATCKELGVEVLAFPQFHFTGDHPSILIVMDKRWSELVPLNQFNRSAPRFVSRVKQTLADLLILSEEVLLCSGSSPQSV